MSVSTTPCRATPPLGALTQHERRLGWELREGRPVVASEVVGFQGFPKSKGVSGGNPPPYGTAITPMYASRGLAGDNVFHENKHYKVQSRESLRWRRLRSKSLSMFLCGSSSEKKQVTAPVHAPSRAALLLPSFTQSPSPPRSLVHDGQTSPLRPRLVVFRSTCPPLSPSPTRTAL